MNILTKSLNRAAMGDRIRGRIAEFEPASAARRKLTVSSSAWRETRARTASSVRC
jgi:hypothetical protein